MAVFSVSFKIWGINWDQKIYISEQNRLKKELTCVLQKKKKILSYYTSQ